MCSGWLSICSIAGMLSTLMIFTPGRQIMKLLLASLALAISAFAQAPLARPEPAAQSYSTDELSLFPTYTRATYKSAFGKDAPAFDITKAPKFWFDSTEKTGTVNYKVLTGVNITPLALPAADASNVNIPPDSQPQMPPVFVVVDSGKRFTSVPGVDDFLQNKIWQLESAALTQTTPIDPAALVAQLAPAAAYVCGWQQQNDSTFHQGTDPSCATQSVVVGKYTPILQTWAQSAATVQDLMGVVPGTPCKFCDAIARSAVSMPIRPLFPDEKVTIASMMGGVLVVRTAPAPPVQVQGGTFTDADRAMLQSIFKALKPLMGN